LIDGKLAAILSGKHKKRKNNNLPDMVLDSGAAEYSCIPWCYTINNVDSGYSKLS